MRWGQGRWQEKKQFTAEQIAWATSPARLREQTGFSLKARTKAFNAAFGLTSSIKRFRRLYREAGITQQKMTSRLGGVKLPSYDKQQEHIRQLQLNVSNMISAGYEFLQCDEALFSVDGYNVARHWAPKG